MQRGKWEKVVMYVKRNEHGVIVQLQEQQPEEYEETKEEPKYRVVGD
ncbi:hypothetical protein [Paenibacillus sp. OAS669]|nr:hypothetical protein [Paenibacillus sp. OAS669]MBE1446813.1 hypothetical protein [Paenibacillus sp. OAS669]